MTSPRMNSPTVGMFTAMIANFATTTSTCPAGTVDNPSAGSTQTTRAGSIIPRQQNGLHGLGAMGACGANLAQST